MTDATESQLGKVKGIEDGTDSAFLSVDLLSRIGNGTNFKSSESGVASTTIFEVHGIYTDNFIKKSLRREKDLDSFFLIDMPMEMPSLPFKG